MSHMKLFEHLKIRIEAIKSATNDFADESCIGRGGFGKVYKGKIAHSEGHTMVALKRLDRAFGQGDPEFWKEIMMLSLYKHKNIVSLLGYCDDFGEKILVYQYAPNRSLELYLNNDNLTWVRRLKICLGAARGLEYLHTDSGTHQRVLHRDIKSANILLDENWNAKISDFGLSKFGPANQKFTFLFSNAVGTVGYCDPLYAETGLLTKESDVFSFGVVLFEVLCGRFCIDSNNKHQSLVVLARQAYEQNRISEIVYGNIKDQINSKSLQVFSKIAYQCLKRDREERPLMTEIVRKLETALRYQVKEIHESPDMFKKRVMGHDPDPVKSMKQGILNVKVLAAMNLKKKNLFGANDHFVTLSLTREGPPLGKTSTKRKTLNPKWYEEFNLVVNDVDVEALVVVVTRDKGKEHDRVGMNVVQLKNLTPEEPRTLTLDLFDHGLQEESSNGQLMIEVVYKPFVHDQIPTYPQGRGSLIIRITKAENVKGKYHNNLSARFIFQGTEKETKAWKSGGDPLWYSIYVFDLEKPPANEILHMKVISTSRMGLVYPEECLGYVNINLTDVATKKHINKMYDLVDSNNGRILIDLEWETSK